MISDYLKLIIEEPKSTFMTSHWHYPCLCSHWHQRLSITAVIRTHLLVTLQFHIIQMLLLCVLQ